MSQNSLVLPTSGTLSGLAAVEAINAALDSLNTHNSGASAPSAPEAGQFWHDTTAGVLRMRSMDNDAWIALGTIDETNYVFNAAVKATPTIFGLKISNDSTAPTTTLDIAAGGAFDATGSVFMRLPAGIKKNLTQPWSAGTGGGSLDTGTFTPGAFYFLFLTYGNGSTPTEIVSSLSYSNPDLTTGYSYSTLIGAWDSDPSSGHLTLYNQFGDYFRRKTSSDDLVSHAASTSAYTLALRVPVGPDILADIILGGINSNPTSYPYNVYGPYESPNTPGNDGIASLWVPGNGGTGTSNYASERLQVITNTGTVSVASAANSSSSVISASTAGFTLKRGLQ